MLADTNQQARKLICARICARDAAGHAETGETQKAWDDFIPPVCRGQRSDRRLSETEETHVVWLITQRRLGAWSYSPMFNDIHGAPSRDRPPRSQTIPTWCERAATDLQSVLGARWTR